MHKQCHQIVVPRTWLAAHKLSTVRQQASALTSWKQQPAQQQLPLAGCPLSPKQRHLSMQWCGGQVSPAGGADELGPCGQPPSPGPPSSPSSAIVMPCLLPQTSLCQFENRTGSVQPLLLTVGDSSHTLAHTGQQEVTEAAGIVRGQASANRHLLASSSTNCTERQAHSQNRSINDVCSVQHAIMLAMQQQAALEWALLAARHSQARHTKAARAAAHHPGKQTLAATRDHRLWRALQHRIVGEDVRRSEGSC